MSFTHKSSLQTFFKRFITSKSPINTIKSTHVTTSTLISSTLNRSFHQNTTNLLGDVPVVKISKNPIKLDQVDEDTYYMPLDERHTVLQYKPGFLKALKLNNTRNFNRIDPHILNVLMKQIKYLNHNAYYPCIVFTTESSTCYSHGIDVTEIYRNIKNDKFEDAVDYYKDSMKAAFYFATCDKPMVCVASGSVLGSGAAFLCHADYSVINSGVTFSIAESTYGASIDHGNSKLLHRAEKKYKGLGMFLGLTGAQIRGYDLIHADIASHSGYPSTGTELIYQLNNSLLPLTKHRIEEIIHTTIESSGEHTNEISFYREIPLIEKCFGDKNSLEEIFDSLQQMNNEWSNHILNSLCQLSPTALKVNFRLLNEVFTNNLPIEACFNLEYRVAVHMMNHPDFKEGVKSTFIEPSKIGSFGSKPVWSAQSIHGVDNDFIDSCFNEELSYEKYATSDIIMPYETWNDHFINNQFEKALKKNQVEYV